MSAKKNFTEYQETRLEMVVSTLPERPYRRLLASDRHMGPGDVVVIAGGKPRAGLWGELLSIAARARDVAGAVCHGLVRDVDQIVGLGFPVFALAASLLDSAGRQEVEAFGEPVEIEGVTIHPGDLIFGDATAVVIVPGRIVPTVVASVEEKRDSESTVRRELVRGDDVEEVFHRHGIL